MPRRGASRSSPMRSSSPITRSPAPPAPRSAMPPAPTRSAAPAPVAQQPSAVGMPQQRGPGLMGQMAATAGGVAIGSTVGHVVGHALTGGGGGGQQQPAEAPQQQAPAQYQQQPYQQQQQYQANPCEYEMREFMNCAQNQHDLTLCQGFQEALKSCKISYGLPLSN